MSDSFDPARVLREILTAHGPLPEADITRLLHDTGAADPDRVLRRLRLGIDVPTAQLVDDRWVWLPALLAGRIFTHRVTDNEVSHNLLSIGPDLAPIAALCAYPPYRWLADESVIRRVTPDDVELLDELGIPVELLDDDGVLALGFGTFARLRVEAGDLVGLRLDAAGLVLERIDTPAADSTGTALAGLLDDRPEFIDTLAWTLCAADTSAFTTAVAPLSELVLGQGLLRLGRWLAPAGFDFTQWGFERRCLELAIRHRLPAATAVTAARLLRLYHRMPVLGDRDQHATAAAALTAAESDGCPGEFAAALADPRIAEALAVETLSCGRFGAGGLRLLAGVLEPGAPAATRAACAWLRAVAAERAGDIAGFEQELLAANAIDEHWPLPLRDLAELAADRGDAHTGLALMARAGAAADPASVMLLRMHLGVARTDVGRNDPCWCGSGRKHKKCHADGRLPLPDRVGWLYHKAIRHVLFGDWTDLRHRLAWQRCRTEILDDADAFNAALADPLVIDLLLFEGNGLADFLKVRGTLLPEDERALARQWLGSARSVFEIEHARPDGAVTALDVCRGERCTVGLRMTDRKLRRGQTVCARVVSDGAALQFYALQDIPAGQRDRLVTLLRYGAEPMAVVTQLGDGAARAA